LRFVLFPYASFFAARDARGDWGHFRLKELDWGAAALLDEVLVALRVAFFRRLCGLFKALFWVTVWFLMVGSARHIGRAWHNGGYDSLSSSRGWLAALGYALVDSCSQTLVDAPWRFDGGVASAREA